jgi:hypothetical protein
MRHKVHPRGEVEAQMYGPAQNKPPTRELAFMNSGKLTTDATNTANIPNTLSLRRRTECSCQSPHGPYARHFALHADAGLKKHRVTTSSMWRCGSLTKPFCLVDLVASPAGAAAVTDPGHRESEEAEGIFRRNECKLETNYEQQPFGNRRTRPSVKLH